MARILYVEGASGKANAVCPLLEQRGHRVHAVDCAERAMLWIHEGHELEAVVLQLYLPGMDGAELCRWMQRSCSHMQLRKMAFTWAGTRMPVDVSQGLPGWFPVDLFVEGLERAEDLADAIDGFLTTDP